MIETIDDLRKRYAVRADKEVFELFMDKCEEFGARWDFGGKPRDNRYGEAIVFDGAHMDRLGLASVSFMEKAGYKRLTLSDFKPTRTEYVQVTESIFDLRDEFESGELYRIRRDDIDGYVKITNLETLVKEIQGMGVYRLVEKVIDWREDVVGYLSNLDFCEIDLSKTLPLTVAHQLDGMVWNNVTEREFLELCRVALRANVEIE